jgi:NTP pyrophosphatase (non-canonical NTP hydrolase)
VTTYASLLRPQPSLFGDGEAPIGLDEYQHFTALTDRNERRGTDGLGFLLLGLFGEVGTLLSVVKKKQRDRASYLGYAPNVIEELGDVLWYFTAIATSGGVGLSDVGHNLNRDYSNWEDGGGKSLRFRDLQSARFLGSKPQAPTPKFEATLLGLVSDVGTFLSDYQAGRLSGNQASLKGGLVRILRTLVKAADEAGVTLEEAANANLDKIFDRWPTERIYPRPLDEDAPDHEKLPRRLTIDVFERDVGGKTYVFQQCNGINIGDRLTDNATEPDDYRFHDVFHYAYCAVLTWSPVVRALLRLKRKSEPQVDEVEDGARAVLIEEGVASWIFGQAKRLDLLAGIRHGELSFDILKAVRQFVAGYEAEQCPLWLWEDAILQGFKAFRFLKERRRGRLYIDMLKRELTVGELSNDA